MDLDFSEVKKPGIFRIAFIGDSFVFGIVPYEFNFTTLLEGRLSAAGRTDVLNMGIPSIGVDAYLKMVKDARRFKPDLVIVGFFIGNDFEEHPNVNRGRFRTIALLRALVKLARLPAFWRHFIPLGHYDDERPGPFSDVEYRDIEIRRSRIYLQRKRPSLESDLKYVLSRLGAMKKACDDSGIHFMVAIFPDEIQVNRALREDVQRYLSDRNQMTPGEWRNRMPDRVLMQALASNGMDALDLTEDFIREGTQNRLYKKNNSHWNLAGHRLAASVLAEALKARGFYSE